MIDSPVYFFWGPENYRIDQEIEVLIDRVHNRSGLEPEVVIVDDDGLNGRMLTETLDYSPLFAWQRIVVLKRPFFLDKTGRKAAKAREFQEVLESYFQHMPEGQILVFTAAERVGTNPVVKLLEKYAQVQSFAPLPATQLRKWLEQQFLERGRSAGQQVIERLARSGQDLYYLRNLVDKLCLMVPEGMIQETHLLGQMESREAVKIFSLVDGLMARQAARALDAYRRLREQGDEPIPMLAMINRQFQTLAAVKHYREAGCNKDRIVEMTGQKDYTVRKMMEVTGNYTWTDLEYVFHWLLETDVGLKSSSKDPDLLMEMLLVSCCMDAPK